MGDCAVILFSGLWLIRACGPPDLVLLSSDTTIFGKSQTLENICKTLCFSQGLRRIVFVCFECSLNVVRTVVTRLLLYLLIEMID